MGFLGGMLLWLAPREERMSEDENRNLAGAPEFSFENVIDGSFMQGVESYLADGFFMRGELVRASSDIKGVFNIKSEEEMLNVDMEQAVNEFIDEAAEENIKNPEDEGAGIDKPGTGTEQTSEETGTDAIAQGDYTFWLDLADGSTRIVYDYPEENLQIAIDSLNAYREALPEDGQLHFFQIPYGYLANMLIEDTTNKYAGWGCNAEDYMQEHAVEGVYIHNGPEILEPYLMERELLYYTTDYHWSALGAYYGLRGIRSDMHLPSIGYDDYDYTVYDCYVGHGNLDNPAARSRTDRLEVMHMLYPVLGSYQVVNMEDTGDLPYMYYNLKSYLAYLSGTLGPWRRIETGADTGRKCLVITDSFGNAFTPYLFPYYDEVHVVDLRPAYFNVYMAGGDVRSYLEHYGIDDIYVMLSTSSSMNSGYMLTYLGRSLDNDYGKTD